MLPKEANPGWVGKRPSDGLSPDPGLFGLVRKQETDWALSRRYNGFVPVEVVLRDFDGSKTIFPTELPLKDIIAASETDLETVEGKIYVKTDEKDDQGRVVYAEKR